jgi:hypothetical protein
VSTQPSDPPPPTGLPLATDPPVPNVPYGGAVEPAGTASYASPLSVKSVAKGAGNVVVAMTIRTVILFVLKMIVKAIFKR